MHTREGADSRREAVTFKEVLAQLIDWLQQDQRISYRALQYQFVLDNALTYTPSHLAEKILTSRSVLEGERKQVTVLFADLEDLIYAKQLAADEDGRALVGTGGTAAHATPGTAARRGGKNVSMRGISGGKRAGETGVRRKAYPTDTHRQDGVTP